MIKFYANLVKYYLKQGQTLEEAILQIPLKWRENVIIYLEEKNL